MTIEQLRVGLKSIIVGENEIQTREGRYCDIDWFLQTFGDRVLTYDSLINHPEAERMGWVEIFDEWKEKGLIK